MTLRKSLVAAALAACSIGCSSSPSSPGAPVAKPAAAPALPSSPGVADATKPARPKPPEPHLQARVYVDTSGSMAGFFGRSKSVVALHAELDATIAELGLRSAMKCTVGLDVKCDGVPSTPAQLGDGANYHEGESRLDKVMARLPPPAQIDPNNPPPPDNLDDARLTVLVTDGMEATAPGAAHTGAAACAQGADPACIQSLLRQRLDEGFGVWLVGVLLPFQGTHYPERTIIPAEFAEVKKHVADLKYDAANKGVQFSVGAALATEKRSGNSTYHYEGFKPILMVVFARDEKLGRGFVQTVTAKLKRVPIQPGGLGGSFMRPDDAVQSIELGPLSAPTLRLARLEILPRGEQKGLPATAYPEIKLEAQKEMASGLSAKVWCGPQGGALMAVSYDRATDGVLPPYFREQVEMSPGPAPPRSLANAMAIDDHRLRTGVSCPPLPPGHTELTQRLVTRAVLDESGVRGQWWSRERWSGEDTWKMPERLYGLEELVLPLLRERAARTTEWGTLHLHVQRD